MAHYSKLNLEFVHHSAETINLPGVCGSLNGFLLELSVHGDGTITLLEKKVSMAFCARSSNSELWLHQRHTNSTCDITDIYNHYQRHHVILSILATWYHPDSNSTDGRSIGEYRVRTDGQKLLSRTFQDLRRPNSKVFQNSQYLLSRTFRDKFGSQTWLHKVQKVHISNQLSVYYSKQAQINKNI